MRGTTQQKQYIEHLEFICEYKKEHDGNSPSYREIQEEFGISTISHVKYILVILEKHGAIRVDPRKSRSISILDYGYELIKNNL